MQEGGAETDLPRRAVGRRMRFIAFGALGIALLWGVVKHSLVAVLVESSPRRAIAISPDDPGALLAMAERAMGWGRAPAEATQAVGTSAAAGPLEDETEVRRRRDADLRRLATVIIAQEPGNARALAILGDLERRSGNDAAAATLLGASVRRSIREPLALGWVIDDAMKRHDWPRVMRHADIMMRYYSDSVAPLVPLLARMLEDPAAAPAVKEAVAAASEWRPHFLSRLPNAVSDVRVPLELFLALKATANPPTISELQHYLSFLIDKKYFDLAYYAWLQFLSSEELAAVRPLFNGSFEIRPSGLPFDWVLTSDAAPHTSIERRSDRPAEHALVIRFGQGRAPSDYVHQLMRLPPGRYQMHGATLGEARGPRGMRWRLRCLGASAQPIGESDMLGVRAASWTAFSFSLTVPEAGCAAQDLRLVLDARTPSERLVSGTISFDELSVSREP